MGFNSEFKGLMEDSNEKVSMYACIGTEIQMWKIFSFKIESRIFNLLHYNNEINL